MSCGEQERPRKTPIGIIAIILGLSVIEPLTHLWLKYGLPEGMAHTGFHIGDTPFFLTSMRIFQNNFLSPYATCLSPAGEHSFTYFALPHHWLYGLIGLAGAALRADPFLWLGLANGLCGALYLYLVYRFLREASPARANLAFVLFTLAGGLGGVLYLAGGFITSHAAPEFEVWFHRYARYELIEGPFLSPTLVLPRLYYTLPMAFGFAALTRLLRRAKQGESALGAGPVLLSFLTAYLNARVGMMFCVVAFIFLWAGTRAPLRARLRLGAAFILPSVAGLFLAGMQFRLNPSGGENVAELLRRCAWFGSLLPLVFWHAFTTPLAIREHLRSLPRLGRVCVLAALGYLGVFAALYFGHQVYYGNLFSGGDTAAAIQVSDYALVGAFLGGLWGFLRRKDFVPPASPDAWMTLWLLSFLGVAISAFGHGTFLRFMPERFLALSGVPLALVSAEGLVRLRARRPKAANTLLGIMLCCGIASLGVGALCFQGPLGRAVVDPAFNWVHSEIMSPEDDKLLAAIPEGMVLTPASLPPLFGDIVVQRNPRTRTLFGQPSLEFSGLRMSELAAEIQYFFAASTSNDERKRLAEKWHMGYIYCPDTRSVDSRTREGLRRAAWLELAGQAGDAMLFKVTATAIGDGVPMRQEPDRNGEALP